MTAGGNYQVEVTFANGCTGISSVHTHSMAGIDDQSMEALIVYPNPASHTLNVAFETAVLVNTDYEIIDPSGRVVAMEKITGATTSIDVSNLEDGLYQLVIKNGTAMNVLRFVKSIY